MHKQAKKLLIISGVIELGLAAAYLMVYVDRDFDKVWLPAILLTMTMVYISEFIKWVGKKFKTASWFQDKKYVKYSEWILNISMTIVIATVLVKAYFKYGSALI